MLQKTVDPRSPVAGIYISPLGIMKVLANVAVLLAIALLPAVRASATVLSELHPLQLQSLRNGEQVLLLENLDGKPWPRIKLYEIIPATPEEVAAVFFDYTNAKAYIPNVMKSQISKRLTPCVLDVDYGVSVPILPSEYYTARNILTQTGDNSYRVDWRVLRALQTKSGEGSLRIEPFEGKTLICYTNLVNPGSSMAVLLKFAAIKQMKNTVQAIVNQVEKVETSEPQVMAREVDAMRVALKAAGAAASPSPSASPSASPCPSASPAH
jgi:hypothetical protein